MATLDGIPVNCTLYMSRVGEHGREGAEIDVDQRAAGHFFDVFQAREGELIFEGEIVSGGERFRGRASAILLNFQPTPTGARLRIVGTGAPERL